MQFSENAGYTGKTFSFFNILARFGCRVSDLCLPISDLRFLGGHKAVVRPVPIPNTAVKHSLADGSGFIDSARVGCRQFFLKGRNVIVSAFLFALREVELQVKVQH